jgi:hypothetical protein
MLDPVGREPAQYTGIVNGRPAPVQFNTLTIGQTFDLGNFDECYKNNTVPEINNSGYFVKLQ